jgi:hypothetical protein
MYSHIQARDKVSRERAISAFRAMSVPELIRLELELPRTSHSVDYDPLG